jgi:hypothetical protein
MACGGGEVEAVGGVRRGRRTGEMENILWVSMFAVILIANRTRQFDAFWARWARQVNVNEGHYAQIDVMPNADDHTALIRAICFLS